MATIDKKQTRWYAKSTFDSLDKTTIPIGTEIQVAGEIEETDLTTDLQKKINGKLTAPTTPIADSAVTILADGTTGTKALSEFGEKLYKYTLTFTNSTGTLDIYSTLANANITTTEHPGGAEAGQIAQFPSDFINTIRRCVWHGEQGDSQALILIGTVAETIENVLKQVLFLEYQSFNASYNTLILPTIDSISAEQ